MVAPAEDMVQQHSIRTDTVWKAKAVLVLHVCFKIYCISHKYYSVKTQSFEVTKKYNAMKFQYSLMKQMCNFKVNCAILSFLICSQL